MMCFVSNLSLNENSFLRGWRVPGEKRQGLRENMICAFREWDQLRHDDLFHCLKRSCCNLGPLLCTLRLCQSKTPQFTNEKRSLNWKSNSKCILKRGGRCLESQSVSDPFVQGGLGHSRREKVKKLLQDVSFHLT